MFAAKSKESHLNVYTESFELHRSGMSVEK